MMQNRHFKKLLLLAAMLGLLALLIFSCTKLLESTVLGEDTGEVGFTSKTVTVDGVDYFPRQDITTVLVMGIDRYGPVADSEAYNNSGAADFNVLVIIDESAQAVDLLYLNRDTMVEMPVLGVGGRQAGTYYGQLALAHTYGSGLEDSCENAKQTVSDMLGGVLIDYYVSMNMDTISILNDAVGGVTVEVKDDFSHVDPTITMGMVTLAGQQAVNYVRTRKDVGDQLNLSRIDRQKEYINRFAAAFRAAYDADRNMVQDLYGEISPYLVTDLSVSVLNAMIDHYGDYTIHRVMTPEGDNVMGEQYFEFYAHEDKLRDLSLELFYAPKE